MFAAELVGRLPDDVVEVRPTLQEEILQQPADLVVPDRGDQCDPVSEDAPECPADVVLAAALADPERPSGPDPPLTRVEPQHHLAERDDVEAAVARRPEGDGRAHELARPRCAAAYAAWVTVDQSRPAIAARGTIHDPPTAMTWGSAR